jgi:integrase
MAKRRGVRGMGTVYESQGSWIASFPLGVVSGKRTRKRERHPSKAAAEDAIARMRRLYGRGGDPLDGTLGEYLDAWLADAKPTMRASTWTSYDGHVRLHIVPLLGGIPVRRLRPADVRRLILDRLAAKSQRGKGTDEKPLPRLSPATVARIVTTLRIALEAAVRQDSLEDNAAAKVTLPAARERHVEAMTEDMAEDAVAAFDKHWLGPLVRLLAGSGLRLGEALSLDQGDLDAGGRFVRFRKSKTTVRAVSISPDAAKACREAIADAPRIGPHEPMFFSPRKNRQGVRDRLRGSTVSHTVPKVLEAHKLARMTPHGYRHGAATRMVAAGVHMRVVADQLGHKNPGFTARVYAHVVPGAEDQAVDTLERRRKTVS